MSILAKKNKNLAKYAKRQQRTEKNKILLNFKMLIKGAQFLQIACQGGDLPPVLLQLRH